MRSPVSRGLRRMQSDHELGIRPQQVDFCQHLGIGSALPIRAFVSTDRSP